MASLAAGATQDFTYTHVFTTEGTHQAWAFVDSGCQIVESNDSNNIAGSVTVPVGNDGVIFRDDFESGNLSAWATCVTDAGDLSVTNAARWWGITDFRRS